MIIGYASDNYPYKRNVIGTLHDAEYTKVQDVFSRLRRTANRPLNRLLGWRLATDDDRQVQYNDLGINKVDLFHFFIREST